jgi:hypothetical protein
MARDIHKATVWPRTLLGAATVAGLLVASTLAGSVPTAAGSASDRTGKDVPAYAGPVSLELVPVHGARRTGHVFTFGRTLDYCGPVGTTQKVLLRELPVTSRRPHPSAVITVIVSFPAYEHPRTCPPEIPRWETLRVRTKRPASSLLFFDGSHDPPQRLFPPEPRR